MAERIFVIGGKGTTGQRVARRLEATGAKVTMGTRRPMDARDRPFDWADPASVAAFEGCSAAYVVAPTDRTDHLDVMRPLLEGAMARGVRRFVLLSSSLLERGGPMMGGVHDWLAGTAPEWAVLRPSWFMQNFSEGPHARTIRDEDAIYSTDAMQHLDQAQFGDNDLRLLSPSSHSAILLFSGIRPDFVHHGRTTSTGLAQQAQDGMPERSLVHGPCGFPRKAGGLA